MQPIPLDLDGAYVVNRREFSTRWPSPARYARDVAAAFPDLKRNGTEDMGVEAKRWTINTHGISPVEAERIGRKLPVEFREDPGPLPSYKVKSRIKSKRQKKGRRR